MNQSLYVLSFGDAKCVKLSDETTIVGGILLKSLDCCTITKLIKNIFRKVS